MTILLTVIITLASLGYLFVAWMVWESFIGDAARSVIIDREANGDGITVASLKAVGWALFALTWVISVPIGFLKAWSG